MTTYLLIETGKLTNSIVEYKITCDSTVLLESCQYSTAYHFLSGCMKQGDILYEVSAKGEHSQSINREDVLQGNWLMNGDKAKLV